MYLEILQKWQWKPNENKITDIIYQIHATGYSAADANSNKRSSRQRTILLKVYWRFKFKYSLK